MLVTTTDIIPGTKVQVLGLVRGNVVTSRHLGRDLMAGLKSMIGGETKTPTELTNDARTIAEQRMEEEAKAKGADAVMSMRFGCEPFGDAVEMLAYGTAVKFVS